MSPSSPDLAAPEVVGRYVLCNVIGGGGMAKVHLGRALGAAGFSRIVAIKRLHPAAATDPELTSMLLDEARLVSRIRHPNVVPTIDVVEAGRELLLVMEYIHGLPVSKLLSLAHANAEQLPVAVAARLALDMLAGLHAAHEAKSERGQPLEIVHRDVSPQNVIVDVEGVARVVDFGVAKAEGKLTMTREGQIKGKLAYMAPEQVKAEDVDRRADVYAAGIILWELLTGRRLFDRQVDKLVEAIRQVMTLPIEPPSTFSAAPPMLDDVVLRALRPRKEDRFATAAEMAAAVAEATFTAEPREVAAIVTRLGQSFLAERSQLLDQVEQLSAVQLPRRPTGPSFAPPPMPLSAPPPTPPAPLPPLPPSLAPPPAREREKKTSQALLVALGIALLVTSVLVVAAVVRVRGSHRRGPVAPTAAPASLASASVAVPGSASSEPSAEPIPDPPSTSPPSSSLASTPPARRPRSARPRASASASTSLPPDCDPPYAIDSRGIRIPRRECLTH